MMKLTIDGYKNKIENKYFKTYKNLILKRLTEKHNDIEYAEVHHILPRSLGGNNEKENLVKFSAREHYIAHLCLAKFITGPGRHKMLFAVTAMSMNCLKHARFNSRLYDSLKKQANIIIGDMSRARWKDNDYREFCIKSQKNSWLDGKRDKQLAYMRSNSALKNKDTHKKTIDKRTTNGTNIWITNNPMKDPLKAKEIAFKRSGANHYLTKKISYEYSLNGGISWIKLDRRLTTKQICIAQQWSLATFNYILNGNIPKRGNMAGVIIRKIDYEDC